MHDDQTDPDLQPEYEVDYSVAKPNRFAAELPRGGRVVVLDPDVAEAFTDPVQVNAILRALIRTIVRPA